MALGYKLLATARIKLVDQPIMATGRIAYNHKLLYNTPLHYTIFYRVPFKNHILNFI